ncbi:MAG: PaaI family thioesterase [Rhodothalassiaceae bacterium]
MKVSPETVNHMMSMAPQLAALAVRVEEIGAGKALMRLPWSPALTISEESGIIAGGAVFTLLDSVLGAAVFTALKTLLPISTLDLRIDYLRPAQGGADILARAHCYRVTRHVAFVRGLAWDRDESDPLAHASATFALDRLIGREASA